MQECVISTRCNTDAADSGFNMCGYDLQRFPRLAITDVLRSERQWWLWCGRRSFT